MLGPFENGKRGRSETVASDGPDSSMLLDRHLPAYDVTQIRHAVVDAEPATTYEAMLTADMADTGPVVRTLGWLRDVPARLGHRLRGTERESLPERLSIDELEETSEWVRIDESPGEEVVFGAVGKFWQPNIEWREIDPDEFADFDEPGYAKLAANLSVRPYGEGRTLLTYEARTATTDEESRRRFRRYWRLVGPFAGYLMGRATERIAADAEALSRRASASTVVDDGTDATRAKPDDSDTVSETRTGPPTESTSSRARLAVVALAVILVAYHAVVRPWHRRWGATDEEATGRLPGDGLCPSAESQVTHAVEIDAPPEDVWPWLVQIGQDRGGFYSYDWLENLIGADIHTAEYVVPEYQALSEGDVVRLAPEDYPISTPQSAPEVALVEPERALVLRPPGEPPAWTWAFVLTSSDRRTTRLLARKRSGALSPLETLLEYLFWDPSHFVMERKMLLGIKRRAEESTRLEPLEE
ncbi:hypothetical protein ACFOZ7_09715 [Natribaculum luteum]|uniref:SRPBCC family protein n=1 Tax=Natribaculum luteum TaxID=1586232 RepID=A0ABD5NZ26_9EURY|nr:hypothetical protein [Natribaculum luteum]